MDDFGVRTELFGFTNRPVIKTRPEQSVNPLCRIKLVLRAPCMPSMPNDSGCAFGSIPSAIKVMVVGSFAFWPVHEHAQAR
jgi:hypothetical protein